MRLIQEFFLQFFSSYKTELDVAAASASENFYYGVFFT